MGRAAKALQDGDTAHLLLDEHPRHARDADAAEDQDDQPHQAQVVLGTCEVLADAVRILPVATRPDEPVRQRLRERRADFTHSRLGRPQQQLVVGAAAEREEPGRLKVRVIHQDARTEAEPAQAAAGFGGDDAANLEGLRANEDAIADAQIQLREQFGAHQRPAAPQTIV